MKPYNLPQTAIELPVMSATELDLGYREVNVPDHDFEELAP